MKFIISILFATGVILYSVSNYTNTTTSMTAVKDKVSQVSESAPGYTSKEKDGKNAKPDEMDMLRNL